MITGKSPTSTCIDFKAPVKRVTDTLYFILSFTTITQLLFNCHQSEQTDQTQKTGLSRTDTTLIIQTVIDEPQLDSILRLVFIDQSLRVLKTEFVNNEYPLEKYGKPVIFTSVDSTNDDLIIWNKPKFYARFDWFKLMTNHQVRVTIVFREIGLLAQYTLERKGDDSWQIMNKDICPHVKLE